MGKGDVRTRKGKISRGTFGKKRMKKVEKSYEASNKPVEKKK